VSGKRRGMRHQDVATVLNVTWRCQFTQSKRGRVERHQQRASSGNGNFVIPSSHPGLKLTLFQVDHVSNPMLRVNYRITDIEYHIAGLIATTIVAATLAALTTAWLSKTAALFTRAGNGYGQLAFLEGVAVEHANRLLHFTL